MTQGLLSEGEKKFIIDGIRTNIRNDGRQRLDVDSFTIELNILPYCVCSAKVILHSTQVIVGFKLEVCEPDPDLPCKGKIQCSVRYSPCSAPWKRNYELESMNFDLSRELQNIMGNSNSINLNDLCIIKNRLCWIIYIDALILENNGNVFDAICLGSNACFKNLIIPSLNIKNIEEYTSNNNENKNNGYVMDENNLFKNTEITKKATINKMRKLQKQKTSKFSGQQLPFQDSIALNSSLTQDKNRIPKQNDTNNINNINNICEIEFTIENHINGQQLNGINNLPIIITMAIMDNNKYFIIDPLYEEELCSDVLIRIAVYSNGNISIIKYGNKSIDPLLIFHMIENGKQSGLKWMKQLNNYLGINNNIQFEMKTDVIINNINFDTLNLEMFKLTQQDEKNIELEMNTQLKKLNFITESLKKEQNGNMNIDYDENKNNNNDKQIENNNNINNVSQTNSKKSFLNDTKINKNKTESFLEESDNSNDNDQEMTIVD